MPDEPRWSTTLLGRLNAALHGRYLLEREIGRGGMAVVFLARDLRHDRRVAIKLLRPEVAALVGVERFKREIQIEAQFQHPHILPLIESDVADDLAFYVMPFVEGETLRARLKREVQLPLDDAIAITEEIADALSYAHSHGVVHRDIKPENILMSAGHALVADFGIARIVSTAEGTGTETGIAVGTPRYMSPEQAGGQSRIDGRSDLYSLACVFYEMLAGEPPFTGATTSAIIAKHAAEPPPSVRIVRPQVPTALEQVLLKALAKTPADRPRTATEFAAALQAAAHAPERPVRAPGWVGKTALLVVAVSFASWWIFRNGSDGPGYERSRIAVLYFEDLTVSRTLSHVTAGLTEELIDRLGDVSALQVIPAAALRPFRDRTTALDSIVERLGVGTVVDGSVDSTTEGIFVRVRLVDGKTLRQLESWNVRRDWTALHVLSQEIANEVTRLLRHRLGREILLERQRAEAGNAEVWDLVRLADQRIDDATRLLRSGDLVSTIRLYLKADSLLARAEAGDRQWVVPSVQRGWVASYVASTVNMLTFRTPTLPGIAAVDTALALGFEGWLLHGIQHADNALRRDPRDARALELRGVLRYVASWSGDAQRAPELLAGAERDLRAATIRDPSRARAWHYLSTLLQDRGEYGEAALAAQTAWREDAYLDEAPSVLQVLFFAALERGLFDSASYWCALGQRRFPSDRRLTECELTHLGWTGVTGAEAAHAWEILQRIERSDTVGMLAESRGYRLAMVAAILARAGLADSARSTLVAAERTASELGAGELDYEAAYVQLLLGDTDDAVARLARYLAENPAHTAGVARGRWFQSLRGNPRYDSLIASQ